MKLLFRSVLVILITALFCCVQTFSGEEKKSIIDSFLSGLPGFHLLTLKELDPDAKEFFLQHFTKANPSVVHADFDGTALFGQN